MPIVAPLKKVNPMRRFTEEFNALLTRFPWLKCEFDGEDWELSCPDPSPVPVFRVFTSERLNLEFDLDFFDATDLPFIEELCFTLPAETSTVRFMTDAFFKTFDKKFGCSFAVRVRSSSLSVVASVSGGPFFTGPEFSRSATPTDLIENFMWCANEAAAWFPPIEEIMNIEKDIYAEKLDELNPLIHRLFERGVDNEG